MKYNIIRTDKADEGIRHTVLYLANHFGNEFALEKLDYIENTILLLEDNPYIGTLPRYAVLKRQGYRVLILEKRFIRLKRVLYSSCVDKNEYLDVHDELEDKVNT